MNSTDSWNSGNASNPNITTPDTDDEPDSALAAKVPFWLNVLELSITLPAFLIVILSSTIVLIVISRCPKLHRTPGFVMAILSTIDIFLAIFDSGNIIIRLADELFGFKLGYFWILCQVRFFYYFGTLFILNNKRKIVRWV